MRRGSAMCRSIGKCCRTALSSPKSTSASIQKNRCCRSPSRRASFASGPCLADSSKKDSSRLDKSAYKLVRPGDIAYNKMRAWQGAIGVSDYQGIISPAYVVQRPREDADSRYLHYLLRTPAFATEAERWSYGITSDMWSLRPEHFRMIYGCLPPPEEQAGIVRFLDHADRRIRRYIAAKKKLIALLNEQKQAIIHHAVTRGLDPDVPLKPSGLSGWEMCRSIGRSGRPAISPEWETARHHLAATWRTGATATIRG